MRPWIKYSLIRLAIFVVVLAVLLVLNVNPFLATVVAAIAGFVLSYIFTGKEALKTGGDEVGRIVAKCAANDTAQRYQRVTDLIADVERLVVASTGAPA